MTNSKHAKDDSSNLSLMSIIVFIFLVVLFSFVGENTYFSQTIVKENGKYRTIYWFRVFIVSFFLTSMFYYIVNVQEAYGGDYVFDKNDGSRVYSLSKSRSR